MGLDPTRGAYVFYDETISAHALLLMYHRVGTRYFVVVYGEARPRTAAATFADLLDAIPIHAMPLAMREWRLLRSVSETRDAWLAMAFAALCQRS